MRLAAPLVLASGSPRRREILTTLRIPFRVMTSDVEEKRSPGEAPRAYAARLAAAKAGEVAGRVAAEQPAPFVLGADTIVVIDGMVLEKPADAAETRAMVTRLGGRWHEVWTAVVVRRAGSDAVVACEVATRVRFRDLDAGEVARYAESGEALDKAGGYAAQGLASGMVAEIEGSYPNVIGLPAVETIDLLRRAGALEEWP
jgi:septum formation protein